jgi:hypothetical protein
MLNKSEGSRQKAAGSGSPSPSPASSSQVTRREVLRQLALAVTAAGSGVFKLEAARVVHALAGEERQAGGYVLKRLSEQEFAAVARLGELIVPAEAGGGSGVDAGAPEFIDLLCGQNDELADIFQGGLAWLDATMRRRGGTTFVDAPLDRQTALLDALVEAERSDDDGDLGPGVSFFTWVRRMTVDAYYTSPIGIADVGYQGNAVLDRFEVPQEAIDFVNRRIAELEVGP